MVVLGLEYPRVSRSYVVWAVCLIVGSKELAHLCYDSIFPPGRKKKETNKKCGKQCLVITYGFCFDLKCVKNILNGFQDSNYLMLQQQFMSLNTAALVCLINLQCSNICT